MKKLLTAIILAATAAITLSGCNAIIESDYVSVTAHEKPAAQSAVPEGPVREASDYQQLRTAISDFVEERAKRGTVRLKGYDRDVEKDVVDACMEVANNTPMGAYAVYYMTSNISKIVSYYEAEILITYSRSAEEMRSVLTATDKKDVRMALSEAMGSYANSLAMFVDTQDIDESFIASCVDELYYSDPSLSVTHPKVTVSSYPQTRDNRIVEVKLFHTYLKSSLVMMQENLLASADELVREAKSLDDIDALLHIAEALSRTVEVKEKIPEDGSQDAWDTDDTAYGALVRNSATSEGFSMAAKLICDRIGIECLVVNGMRNAADYSWNIVKLDDAYYHIDISRSTPEDVSAEFFKNDSAMTEEYLWDAVKYPKCDGTAFSGDPGSIDLANEPERLMPTAR